MSRCCNDDLININQLKERFLRCGICVQEYDELDHIPRVLPCLHTICTWCILRIIKPRHIDCPYCKTRHLVTESRGVESFPKDNTRRDLLEALKAADKPSLIICKVCDDKSRAKYRCRNCADYLCDQCYKAHRRTRLTKDHKILRLEEVLSFPELMKEFICEGFCKVPGHETDQLRIYCSAPTCCKPICYNCAMIGHRNHSVKELAEVYADKKQNLISITDEIKVIKQAVETKRENVELEIQKIQSSLLNIKRDIEEYFDDCKHKLLMRKLKLKEEADEIMKRKQENLYTQRELFDRYIEKLETGCQFTDETLMYKDVSGFLEIEGTIIHQLLKLKEETVPDEPYTNAAIKFRREKMSDECQSFLDQMGMILAIDAYPPNTTVNIPDQIYEGQDAKITFQLHNYRDEPILGMELEIGLTDSNDQMIINARLLIEKMKKEYTVIFTPSITGTHQITIKAIDGKVHLGSKKFKVLPQFSPTCPKENNRHRHGKLSFVGNNDNYYEESHQKPRKKTNGISDARIEELESLFSEHFGRTPTSTPIGSQASQEVNVEEANENSDSEDDVSDYYFDVDERSRMFLQSSCNDINSNGDEEVDEDNHDDENDGDSDDELLTGDTDVERIRKFCNDGCGCSKNCSDKIKCSDTYRHILNMREMDKQEKDMYIMATIVNRSDKEQTKRGKKRQRMRHQFLYLGESVCKKTFMLVFDIGKHSLQSIMKHVSENGAVPRTHGNTGRKPVKALRFDDIQRAVLFISNFAEEYGLPQPAAPRGTDNIPPVYLPCDTTKMSVHEKYQNSCEELETPVRYVMYSTFCKIWTQCLPHIKIASPRDDVCATCEKSRKAIMDAVTEEEKLEATNKMREHITYAQKERELYNKCIEKAKNPDVGYVHYTFDFCQHVTIPHHARQMGPLYFVTPRKVQIFGFRVDGIPRQLNFLIDENETIGIDGTLTNGPNTVISMIHWALQNHGSFETTCAIHADNCPGQNKHQFVIGFFMWRVMTGRHSVIEYMMQVPGHARCHVDSGFASIKKLYRRSDSDSLDQLHTIVEKSAITNSAVRYPAWSWRNWKTFLKQAFRPLKGIRQYQYFRFSSQEPGIVTVKKNCDADEEKISIMKPDVSFSSEVLPDVLNAGGLTIERQLYLYSSVRQYVRPAYKDVTCPPVTETE